MKMKMKMKMKIKEKGKGRKRKRKRKEKEKEKEKETRERNGQHSKKVGAIIEMTTIPLVSCMEGARKDVKRARKR
jgi:hypothetical protein